MKVGLISDIHSNAVALTTVLRHLEENNVESVLCAGDVVGYYPMPNNTIKALIQSQWEIPAVLGNHDAAVIDNAPLDFSINAKRATDWTRRELSARSREYLENLPLEYNGVIGEIETYVTHGSPENPLNEYIWEEEIDERTIRFWFGDSLPDLVVLGHTHQPYVRKVGATTFVNPGSVGQPRDGNPKASFVIVDSESLNVNRYRVEYDIDKIAELTKEYLPRSLADRLYEGK